MDFINEQVKGGGLNPSNYTEDQKWLMTEPSNGPENFYCDGEINHTTAMARWKTRLRNSGLSEPEIKKCVKMNFGS